MALDLYNLLQRLRNRLHDPSEGQWTLADKKQYINSARRRTLIRTRSWHKVVSATLASGTHTYDGSPVFRPDGVRFADATLDPTRPSDMPVLLQNWDVAESGTPTQWLHLGGGKIRVSPTPDADAASIISTVSATPTAGGQGYAVGDILEITPAGSSAADGRVIVTSIGANPHPATGVELYGTDDGRGKKVHQRGSGYTTGTGKATTAETGSGTGCTINITAIGQMVIYGPSLASRDLRCDNDACTVAASTDRVTATAHGLAVNDPIVFHAVTGGMTVGTVYYVAQVVDANTFTFSASEGGSVFDITADGSNTFSDAVVEVSELGEEALLLAAEQEARMARPHMPGSLEAARQCFDLWVIECKDIRDTLGII